jgi:hypothetical protein
VTDQIDALIPPIIMAILFVAVVRTIIASQNPQKRAAARAREHEAEQADPRFASGAAASAAAAVGSARPVPSSDPTPGGRREAQ